MILTSLFITLVLATVTYGTTCVPKTSKTCRESLHVLPSCVNGKCQCASDYTAVPTGCAFTSAIPTPSVTFETSTPGVFYSGEVSAPKKITLTCSTPNSNSGSLTYKWFVDNAIQTSQTESAYEYTTEEDMTVDIQCQVSDGGLKSNLSENFQVIGFDGTTYILSKIPVIKVATIRGTLTGVVKGSTVSMDCDNIPNDYYLRQKWQENDTPHIGTRVNNIYSTDLGGNTYVCILSISPSNIESQPLTLPSAAHDAAILITGFEIYSPAPNFKVPKGKETPVSCRVSNSGVVHASSDITLWAWTVDGTSVTGTTSELTFDTSKLTIGDHAVICKGTPKLGSAISSTALLISVVEQFINNVEIVTVTPSTFVGGYMELKCLVAAPTLDGLVYQWLYGSKQIAGQSDNRIQINGLVELEHGNTKSYTCKVGKGSFQEEGSTPPFTFTSFAALTPIVEIPKTSTYFGIGNNYTATCILVSPGVTYKWWKGTDVQTETTQTMTFTATDNSTDYTCAGVFDSGESLNSSALSVLGKAIMGVTIEGPSKPVVGTSAAYKCMATLAPGVTPTYLWKKDGKNIAGETSSTYTISNVVLSTADGTYTCVVTSGTEKPEATIGVVAVDNPETPTISRQSGATSPFTLRKSGTYVFYCSSTSSISSASVEWTFIPTAGGKPSFPFGKALKISNPSASIIGKYTCKIKIKGKNSSPSAVLAFVYEDKAGKPCTQVSDCFGNTNNTGNCIAGTCQCKNIGDLKAEGCGVADDSIEDSTGSAGVTFHPAVIVTLMSMALTWLF